MIRYQFRDKLQELALQLKANVQSQKPLLLLARLNSPVYRIKLIGQLVHVLESKGVVLRDISLSPRFSMLQQIEKESRHGTVKIDAIAVNSFDSTMKDLSDESKLAELLENFGKDIGKAPLPVMLWLPTYIIDIAYRKAPNFWNLVEGKIIEFKSDEDLPKETEYAPEPQDPAEARQKRIEIMESQLEDVKSKPGVSNNEFAHVLQLLGKNYFEDGQFEKAFEAYSETLAQMSPETNPVGRASALHQLGVVLHLWGRYDKAEAHYIESIKLKKTLADSEGLASTMHQLGLLYQDLGEFERAIDFYTKSISYNKALGYPRGIASSLVNLGSIYEEIGLYAKAVEKYREAFEIYRSMTNQRGMAVSLTYTGKVYEEKAMYKEAVKYFYAAKTMFERLGLSHKDIVAKNLQTIESAIGADEYEKIVEESRRTAAARKA